MDTRFSGISSQKRKIFAKPFLPVHMGPRSNLLRKKNGQKSRDTVPLTDPDLGLIFVTDPDPGKLRQIGTKEMLKVVPFV